MVSQVFYCVLFWGVGFVLSVAFVLPFVVVHHVKGAAASACSEIRGI